MTTETNGRKLLATELLKDGYHERAERVAAGNECMSDEPAVRACVAAVGEREAGATARELLIDACRYTGIEPPPGHMLLAPFTDEAGPWLAAIKAIEAALALPSPVRQGEDGGVTRSSAGRSAGPADPSHEDASRPTAAAANARSVK